MASASLMTGKYMIYEFAYPQDRYFPTFHLWWPRPLYFLGVAVFSIALQWLLQEPSYKSLLALLGSIPFFVADFVNYEKNSSTHRLDELPNYSFDSLKRIAKEHGIVVDKKNKEGYLNAILLDRKIKSKKYFDLYRSVISVFALILSVIFLFIYPPLWGSFAPLSFSFYDSKDGVIELTGGRIPVTVNGNDIESGIVKVPIQIALRNDGNSESVDINKIEFYYPTNLKVRSTGSPKIDPSGGVLIYEHNFKKLMPEGLFTPLETIDTLMLNIDFPTFVHGQISNNEVPSFFISILNPLKKDTMFLDWEMKIYSEGRPVSSRKSFLSIVLDNIIIPDTRSDSTVNHVSTDDQIFFLKEIDAQDIVQDWTILLKENNHKLRYVKVVTEDITAQYVYVNDRLRKVSVDRYSDRTLDYTLIDSDDGIGADVKFFPKDLYLIDWYEVGFEKR